MKTVFLTGGSGFVGSNMVRRLLKDGNNVHLLLRKNHEIWRIKEIINDVTVHLIDLLDHAGLQKVVYKIKPDWIFHLAVFGAYSTQNDVHKMVDTNLTGTINLMEACQKVGFESFINTGSSSEYGFKNHPPSENEALDPNSYYSLTKATSAMYCRYMAEYHDLNICTLRLYSIFGPFEVPTRLIPTLIIHGLQNSLPPLVDPDIARDFVYTDDVCEAFISAASNPKNSKGQIYNVGSGKQTKLEQVVAIASQLMNITAKPKWSTMPNRKWDTKSWYSNSKKIKKQLGWRPKIDFASGLQKTIDWFIKNPQLIEYYKKVIRDHAVKL